MNTRVNLLAVGFAIGIGGSVVLAQPETAMTYSIVWEKSQIAPGETNNGKVVCTIEPGLGTVVPWTTPPGKGQPGAIKSFASSIIDVVNVLNGKEGQLSWRIPATLNISGKPGMLNANGDIVQSCSGQVAPPTNPGPIIDNPIALLTVDWTASTQVSSPFDVQYSVKATSGKMFIDIGLPSGGWVGHNATKLVSGPSGGFTVIPAPGAASAIVLAGFVTLRRRR
jgi:hypothetical protein